MRHGLSNNALRGSGDAANRNHKSQIVFFRRILLLKFYLFVCLFVHYYCFFF